MAIARAKHPRLVSVDAASGGILWSYEFDGRTVTEGDVISFTHAPETRINVISPQILALEGQGSLLVAAKDICSLDETSGRVLWKLDKEATGKLQYDGAGHLLGQLDERLCRLDAKTGSVLWKSEKKTGGGFYVQCPFLVHGPAAYVCMDGRVAALALVDGKEMWKSKVKLEGLAEFLDLSPEGELTVLCPGKYKMEDAAYEGDYSVHRIDLKTGEAKWDFSEGSNIRLWGVRADGRIMAFEGKRFLELEPATGKAAMKLAAKKVSQSVLDGDNLYLFGEEGVACYHRKASTLTWQAELEPAKEAESTCYSVLGSLVLFPTKSDGVLGLSAADGSRLWNIPTPKNPKAFLSRDSAFLAVGRGKELSILDLRQ
jgi:outer membrane protein assembly factor BamB